MESSSTLRDFRHKCRIVPLGIPLQRFLQERAAQVRSLRREFGSPLLLFVGALRYYKGLQYLIEALAQLPEPKLLVIGSGPMLSQWEELARRAGVAQRVRFLGHVDDASLPAYYHACDLFVLPSHLRAEAFGISLVEAMASGRPAVSTELGTGTSYVNQHRKTGLVVPPADPDALAAAIDELLGDEHRRRAMGIEARARAQAEFGLPGMVDRILATYDDMLRPEE
jgi:rhamnosyl/mannosyltransferase